MKAAFIVMSILGCDDAGIVCTPVAQVEQQWQTIAACDAASDAQLTRFANLNHPTIVAVCQTENTTALDDSKEEVAQIETLSRANAPESLETDHDRGIASRAVSIVRNALPSRKGLTDAASYPVHVVTGTYSWVARKITN